MAAGQTPRTFRGRARREEMRARDWMTHAREMKLRGQHVTPAGVRVLATYVHLARLAVRAARAWRDCAERMDGRRGTVAGLIASRTIAARRVSGGARS